MNDNIFHNTLTIDDAEKAAKYAHVKLEEEMINPIKDNYMKSKRGFDSNLTNALGQMHMAKILNINFPLKYRTNFLDSFLQPTSDAYARYLMIPERRILKFDEFNVWPNYFVACRINDLLNCHILGYISSDEFKDNCEIKTYSHKHPTSGDIVNQITYQIPHDKLKPFSEWIKNHRW